MNAVRSLAVLFFAVAAVAFVAPRAAHAQKYVGVAKCKTCHDTKDMGQQVTKWKTTKHAKAFETLANEESKKIAKAKGIADAQKDEKCVKCHTGGAGAPAEKLAASYKKEDGVSCEACHGPGEKHVKARMASEEEGEIKIPAGEIVAKPEEKVCAGCHNKESPTFKSFKYADAWKEIAHPKPAKAAK